MLNKTILCMVLLIVAIGLSGCVEQQVMEPNVLPAPVINVKTFIEERTGDPFMSGWEKKPVGWYNKYEDKPVSWYVDTMQSPSSMRDVDVILITEDREPHLVVRYSDGYYQITQPDNSVMRSVPRGYPDGGKRVYQIKISFNLDNIKDGNLITVKNDYYDVKGNIFHIEFDSKGTVGYS